MLLKCKATANSTSCRDMMRLPIFIFALAQFFPLTCQHTTSRTAKAAGVSVIYQFPSNTTWLENIIVRSNGQLLTTRLDAPELWAIDPETKIASLLHTFSGVSSLAGITELQKDVFAIAGLKFDANPPKLYPGSGTIFTADLRAKPSVYKTVGTLQESLVLNGLTTWDAKKGIVLVGDSSLGLVQKFDISTGIATNVSRDPLLTGSRGVNGLKSHENYLYFTNSAQHIFGRMPLSKEAKPAGPVEVVAQTDVFLDDFVLDRDGGAYIATNSNNTVIKVTKDANVDVVAGGPTNSDVAGSTSLAWACEEDGELYGATTTGRIFKISLGR
jgi:hypothetical protein